MAFEDLFKVYPNRNAELRAVSLQAYEFGKTISKEPSAALSSGLDEHAVRRQISYIDYIRGMVNALNARPIPDLPASHPLSLEVNMSVPYVTFTTDVGGEQIPLNEQTQLLAQYWMITAVEMAKSQSASLAGSLVEFDWQRALNNLDVMEKMLTEIASRPILDLPETAEPGSGYQVPTVGAKK